MTDRDSAYEERIAHNNAYYDCFAEKVAGRHAGRDYTRAIDLFCRFADPDRTVLDIGCGNGEHLLEFRQRGLRALGIEPSTRMREIAGRNGDVVDGSFETLCSLALPPVGGIWCAASLLHVPVEELPSVLGCMHSLLESGRPLFLTVRLGEGASWDSWDDPGARGMRFLQLFDEKDIISILEEKLFRIADRWVEDSTWGRASQWLSVVALA